MDVCRLMHRASLGGAREGRKAGGFAVEFCRERVQTSVEQQCSSKRRRRTRRAGGKASPKGKRYEDSKNSFRAYLGRGGTARVWKANSESDSSEVRQAALRYSTRTTTWQARLRLERTEVLAWLCLAHTQHVVGGRLRQVCNRTLSYYSACLSASHALLSRLAFTNRNIFQTHQTEPGDTNSTHRRELCFS